MELKGVVLVEPDIDQQVLVVVTVYERAND